MEYDLNNLGNNVKIVAELPVELVASQLRDHFGDTYTKTKKTFWISLPNGEKLKYNARKQNKLLTWMMMNYTCVSCGARIDHFPIMKMVNKKRENLPDYNIIAVSRRDDGSLSQFTKDHIRPKNKLGGNHQTNLQLMCGICNTEKGNQLPSDLPLLYGMHPTYRQHLFDELHKANAFDEEIEKLREYIRSNDIVRLIEKKSGLDAFRCYSTVPSGLMGYKLTSFGHENVKTLIEGRGENHIELLQNIKRMKYRVGVDR